MPKVSIYTRATTGGGRRRQRGPPLQPIPNDYATVLSFVGNPGYNVK
jgi:hypothetical protein